jgi:hypothetical protein
MVGDGWKQRTKNTAAAVEPMHNLAQSRTSLTLLCGFAGHDEARRLAFMPAYISQQQGETTSLAQLIRTSDS